MQLTYHEVAEILNTKYIDAKPTGYTFLPGIYEVSDIIKILKFLLPKEVYTIMGFTQSHSRPLGDIDGFV